MNQIKVKDIMPPRGELMSLEAYKAYIRNRINILEQEGRINSEFAKQLLKEWCYDTA